MLLSHGGVVVNSIGAQGFVGALFTPEFAEWKDRIKILDSVLSQKREVISILVPVIDYLVYEFGIEKLGPSLPKLPLDLLYDIVIRHVTEYSLIPVRAETYQFFIMIMIMNPEPGSKADNFLQYFYTQIRNPSHATMISLQLSCNPYIDRLPDECKMQIINSIIPSISSKTLNFVLQLLGQSHNIPKQFTESICQRPDIISRQIINFGHTALQTYYSPENETNYLEMCLHAKMHVFRSIQTVFFRTIEISENMMTSFIEKVAIQLAKPQTDDEAVKTQNLLNMVVQMINSIEGNYRLEDFNTQRHVCKPIGQMVIDVADFDNEPREMTIYQYEPEDIQKKFRFMYNCTDVHLSKSTRKVDDVEIPLYTISGSPQRHFLPSLMLYFKDGVHRNLYNLLDHNLLSVVAWKVIKKMPTYPQHIPLTDIWKCATDYSLKYHLVLLHNTPNFMVPPTFPELLLDRMETNYVHSIPHIIRWFSETLKRDQAQLPQALMDKCTHLLEETEKLTPKILKVMPELLEGYSLTGFDRFFVDMADILGNNAKDLQYFIPILPKDSGIIACLNKLMTIRSPFLAETVYQIYLSIREKIIQGEYTVNYLLKVITSVIAFTGDTESLGILGKSAELFLTDMKVDYEILDLLPSFTAYFDAIFRYNTPALFNSCQIILDHFKDFDLNAIGVMEKHMNLPVQVVSPLEWMPTTNPKIVISSSSSIASVLQILLGVNSFTNAVYAESNMWKEVIITMRLIKSNIVHVDKMITDNQPDFFSSEQFESFDKDPANFIEYLFDQFTTLELRGESDSVFCQTPKFYQIFTLDFHTSTSILDCISMLDKELLADLAPILIFRMNRLATQRTSQLYLTSEIDLSHYTTTEAKYKLHGVIDMQKGQFSTIIFTSPTNARINGQNIEEYKSKYSMYAHLFVYVRVDISSVAESEPPSNFPTSIYSSVSISEKVASLTSVGMWDLVFKLNSPIISFLYYTNVYSIASHALSFADESINQFLLDSISFNDSDQLIILTNRDVHGFLRACQLSDAYMPTLTGLFISSIQDCSSDIAVSLISRIFDEIDSVADHPVLRLVGQFVSIICKARQIKPPSSSWAQAAIKAIIKCGNTCCIEYFDLLDACVSLTLPNNQPMVDDDALAMIVELFNSTNDGNCKRLDNFLTQMFNSGRKLESGAISQLIKRNSLLVTMRETIVKIAIKEVIDQKRVTKHMRQNMQAVIETMKTNWSQNRDRNFLIELLVNSINEDFSVKNSNDDFAVYMLNLYRHVLFDSTIAREFFVKANLQEELDKFEFRYNLNLVRTRLSDDSQFKREEISNSYIINFTKLFNQLTLCLNYYSANVYTLALSILRCVTDHHDTMVTLVSIAAHCDGSNICEVADSIHTQNLTLKMYALTAFFRHAVTNMSGITCRNHSLVEPTRKQLNELVKGTTETNWFSTAVDQMAADWKNGDMSDPLIPAAFYGFFEAFVKLSHDPTDDDAPNDIVDPETNTNLVQCMLSHAKMFIQTPVMLVFAFEAKKNSMTHKRHSVYDFWFQQLKFFSPDELERYQRWIVGTIASINLQCPASRMTMELRKFAETFSSSANRTAIYNNRSPNFLNELKMMFDPARVNGDHDEEDWRLFVCGLLNSQFGDNMTDRFTLDLIIIGSIKMTSLLSEQTVCVHVWISRRVTNDRSNIWCGWFIDLFDILIESGDRFNEARKQMAIVADLYYETGQANNSDNFPHFISCAITGYLSDYSSNLSSFLNDSRHDFVIHMMQKLPVRTLCQIITTYWDPAKTKSYTRSWHLTNQLYEANYKLLQILKVLYEIPGRSRAFISYYLSKAFDFAKEQTDRSKDRPTRRDDPLSYHLIKLNVQQLDKTNDEQLKSAGRQLLDEYLLLHPKLAEITATQPKQSDNCGDVFVEEEVQEEEEEEEEEEVGEHGNEIEEEEG